MKTSVRIIIASTLLMTWVFSYAQEAPKNYALVIGINEYVASMEGVNVLKYAVDDAEEVQEVLEDLRYEVVPLIGPIARRESIITELVRLAGRTREQDSVLIYFAGHGVRNKLGNGEHSYWLTYDSTLARLEIEGLRLTHLLDYVNDIPAGKKLLVLDHCHSGRVSFRGSGSSGGRAGTGAPFVDRNLFFSGNEFASEVETAVARGLVVVGAASKEAYEFDDLGHGLLTHLFLEALISDKADENNNGKLTVNELRQYLITEVTEEAAARDIVQEPIEIMRGANLNWDIATVIPLKNELHSFIANLNVQGNLDANSTGELDLLVDTWDSNNVQGVVNTVEMEDLIEKLIRTKDLPQSTSWQTKAQVVKEILDEWENNS